MQFAILEKERMYGPFETEEAANAWVRENCGLEVKMLPILEDKMEGQCIGDNNSWTECRGPVMAYRQKRDPHRIIYACSQHAPCPICGVYNSTSQMVGVFCANCASGSSPEARAVSRWSKL